METEVFPPREDYDKQKWPDGPWKTEPDKAWWQHEGLDCLIVRGPMGALNGYVGVTNDHPLHKKGKDESCEILDWLLKKTLKERFDISKHDVFKIFVMSISDDKPKPCPCLVIRVHGGITYSESGNDFISIPSKLGLWYFGFDCGHGGDYQPKLEWSLRDMRRLHPDMDPFPEGMFSMDIYRNFEYVKKEVETMAQQLRAIDYLKRRTQWISK